MGETQTFDRVLVVEGGQIVEDGIPAVQPDEEKRTIRAYDIAELLEVSVKPAAMAMVDGAIEVPPGVG